MLGQQGGQQPGRIRVAGVGPGAQYLCGPVKVAALGQQVGKPHGGIPVAGAGPGAQPVKVAALGQQAG